MNDDDSISLQYRKVTVTIIVCLNLTFFIFRQLLTRHLRTINHKLGYLSKEKKISFFFFFFLIDISKNFPFRKS